MAGRGNGLRLCVRVVLALKGDLRSVGAHARSLAGRLGGHFIRHHCHNRLRVRRIVGAGKDRACGEVVVPLPDGLAIGMAGREQRQCSQGSFLFSLGISKELVAVSALPVCSHTGSFTGCRNLCHKDKLMLFRFKVIRIVCCKNLNMIFDLVPNIRRKRLRRLIEPNCIHTTGIGCITAIRHGAILGFAIHIAL